MNLCQDEIVECPNAYTTASRLRSRQCAVRNGRPRTEDTMISTRSLSVLVLVLLAAACGSTSDPNSMPAANGGGGVQGNVMGSGTQNMRVAVPWTTAPPFAAGMLFGSQIGKAHV